MSGDPVSMDRTRKERIFLTGFMGCGKSTIGPILANVIGYDFLDIDRLIEAEAGRSVNAIFLGQGEEYFRKLERSILSRVAGLERMVIALGGGTMADPANLQTITASGLVIYLRVHPEQLFKRLHLKKDRPVLRHDDGERLDETELRQRIEDLFRAREPYYVHADLVVDTDEKRLGLTVDLIVKKIAPLLR